MSLLIYAGLLYLFGISIVIALKPELMFSKEGHWKEFGLGRHPAKYTWLPFWLFAIVWAIMSYMIILVIASNTGLGGVTHQASPSVDESSFKKLSKAPSMNAISPMNEMKKGYYLLDTNASMKSGLPKYVYLGPKAPNLVFHEQSDASMEVEHE